MTKKRSNSSRTLTPPRYGLSLKNCQYSQSPKILPTFVYFASFWPSESVTKREYKETISLYKPLFFIIISGSQN